MKVQLVKREDRWDLYDNTGHKIASSLDGCAYKLSLKNCEEIERASPKEEYVLEVNGEGWDDHQYKGNRKPTEWDVEIEMERSQFIVDKSLRNDIKNGFNYTTKLDADGCLILKKKENG